MKHKEVKAIHICIPDQLHEILRLQNETTDKIIIKFLNQTGLYNLI